MPAKKMVKKRSSKKITPANPISTRKNAENSLQKSIASGKWMAVAFRVEGERLFIDWSQVNFPKHDIDSAIRMFTEDMEQLKKS